MLGKIPIEWRQRPDMTIAVDGDVKHQSIQLKFKQRNASIELNENISFIALYIYISNDTKIVKNRIIRRSRIFFSCKRENILKSMEILTLWTLS